MAWTLMNVDEDRVVLTLEHHGTFTTSASNLDLYTSAAQAEDIIEETYEGTPQAGCAARTINELPPLVVRVWAAMLRAPAPDQ